MSLGYAHEKFSNAVRSLAVSPYSIHQRLMDATVHHLIHVDIERDLPNDLKDAASELMHRLTKEPLSETEIRAGEGTIHASVRKLSTEQAVEVAQEIVALAYQIESYYNEKPLA